jgi:hypothetical protein
MTAYKLNVLQLAELRECTVECPHCHTRISLALGIDRMAPVPKACPTCPQTFDDNLGRVLAGLREAHTYAAHTNFKVEFHIRTETEKTKE